MPVTLAVALAILAYVISLRALSVARQSQRPNAAAAAGRGRPLLEVLEGQARRDIADDSRDYALVVAVTNDSDTPVTLSGCVLRVTYRTRANFLGAVDLEPRTDVELRKDDPRPVVRSTFSVAVHQRLECWLLFNTRNIIPRHCRVQEYALVAFTGDGRRLIVDASLPTLLAADTDGQGPATWGWD
jgi:hypothetical protein